MSEFGNVLKNVKGAFEREGGSDIERFFKIGQGDSLQVDAFGRLRTSSPFDLIDHKAISGRDADNFDEIEDGGSLTWDYQTSSVNYSFTADGSSKRVLRQTHYLPYTSGKGHLAEMTGILDDGNPNSQYRIVKRSSVSGSIVDSEIEQSNWNIDTLVGSGLNNPSGKRVFLDKINIFYLDLQWLGSGRVRTAITEPITGFLKEAHRFLHAGISDNVYIRTGSLPIRYELVTDGTTVRARIGYFDDNDGIYFECYKPEVIGTTYLLKEICITCSSEGAIRPSGRGYHANTRGNQSTATVGGVDVLALRLKNTYGTYSNRHLAFLSNAQFFAASESTMFEIYKVTSYTEGTMTWTDVNTNSACEYAAGNTNIDITVLTEHMIDCAVVTASSSGSKAESGAVGVSSPFSILDMNRFLKQNYDSTQSQMFLVRAYTMSSTSLCGCSLSFLEVE